MFVISMRRGRLNGCALRRLPHFIRSLSTIQKSLELSSLTEVILLLQDALYSCVHATSFFSSGL